MRIAIVGFLAGMALGMAGYGAHALTAARYHRISIVTQSPHISSIPGLRCHFAPGPTRSIGGCG